MARLLRIVFSSIGHREARLDPVVLDLRGGGGGVDSVLWLRNGGGKTSIINLFFSLFRPHRAEFLGSTAEGRARRLGDYVKATDLAFVVSEWDLAPALDPTQAPTDVRLLGQVLAWKGGQLSNDQTRLDRMWFSLRSEEPFVLDSLPIRGLGAPLGSFDNFRDWLRQSAHERPSAEIVETGNQRVWLEHLEAIGLDPQLFKYQLDMNRREGAADEVFRFGSANDFVRFLLELAFEPAAADQVVSNLAGLREQLLRRPQVMLELRFLATALAALHPFTVAVRARHAARAGLAASLSDVAAMCAGLDACEGARAREVERLRQSAAEAEGRMKQASNEQDKFGRWARGLELRALELDISEADDERQAAERRSKEAERALVVAQAGATLAEVRRLHAEADEVTEALRRSALALEPLQIELANAAAVLRRALTADLDRRRADLADLETQLALGKTTLGRQREAQLGLAAKAASEGERITGLEATIARRDRERDRLVVDGWLDKREAAMTGVDRWKAVATDVEQRRLENDGRLETARIRLAEIADRTAVVTGERMEQERLASRLRAEHDEAMTWRDRLAATAELIEIEGIDVADPFAPGLEARLLRHAERLQRELLEAAVDGAEDRHVLDVLIQTGLVPPAKDSLRVRDELRRGGHAAHAGVSYLAENVPSTRAEALLRGDPARFGGVMVLSPPALAAARTLSSDLGLRTPVQVSLIAPGDLEARDPQDRVVTVPPTAATYDVRAGEQRRVELEAVAGDRERRENEIAAARRRFDEVAGDVRRFVLAHGGGKLAERERAASAAQERVSLAIRELAAMADEKAAIGGTIERLGAEQRELATRIAHANRAVDKLMSFVDHHEAGIEQVRADLEGARRDRREAERTLLDLAAEIERSEKNVGALEDRRRSRIQACEEIEAERGAVAGGEGQSEEDVDLDQARPRYRLLREQFDRAVSENRLAWQLEQLGAKIASTEALYRRQAHDIALELIEEVAALADPTEEIARRQTARDGCLAAASAHSAATAIAQKRLAEAQRRREASDLPSDRAVPATAASARRAAEDNRALQAEAGERRRQHDADGKAATQRANELAIEGKELAGRADGLRRLIDGASLELPSAPPVVLPEGDALVTAVVATTEGFKKARDVAAAAEREVVTGAESLRRLASDSAVSDLRSQYRERLKEDTESLAAAGDRLLVGLGERRIVLDEQLRAIEQDRAILVGALVGLGDDAERLLRRAASASVLPAGLGAWTGKPYLRIDFQFPAAVDERRARIEPLIERLIDRARLEGRELVQEVVAELAGNRGFEVRILKPDSVLRPDPLPITAMTTFSRGQQLTAAILLYCTLVQLRARSRGRRLGATDAGMLLLDNPIGTCSSVPLLELQRTIARQMRVQLIYATGVDDLEALDTLPNKVRLRNAHRDRTTGDQHVTLEGHLEAVRVVEQVPR